MKNSTNCFAIYGLALILFPFLMAGCLRESKPSWYAKAGVDQYGKWADMEITGHGMTTIQRFRWIEPGIFVMGSPNDESMRSENECQHQEKIRRGFWLADTECSQEMWKTVTVSPLPSSPIRSPSNLGAKLPVTQVNYHHITDPNKGFFQQLHRLFPDHHFRLPTEVEWEYACRSGTTSRFAFGPNVTNEQVNMNDSFEYSGYETNRKDMQFHNGKIMPVQSFSPNAWGLYDMHGNVFEWCDGIYGQNPMFDPEIPHNKNKTGEQIIRGGSWDRGVVFCRSAKRETSSQKMVSNNIGFRFIVDE